ncbi:MAG: DUF6655 family protein [Candidatus Sumerlaeia bacterium]
MKYRLLVAMAFCLISLSLFSGCTQWERSVTPRTAIEQLLISTAADRAVNLDRLQLDGKKVFIDTQYVESYDEKYVISNFRNAVAKRATLVEKAEDAEVILEPRVGALAINQSEFLIGFPSITLPVPVNGEAAPLKTPELPFFKILKNRGRAKFTFFSLEKESRQLLGSSGPHYGKAYWNDYILFFIPFSQNNVFGDKADRETAKREAEKHNRMAE